VSAVHFAGMTVVVSKPALRAEMRERVASVPEADRGRASEVIAARVLALPELEQPAGVLCCLSFGAEPDTWPLVEQLARRGHRLHVPRARAADTSLRVHPWPCPLVTLSFGLRQPHPEAPELASEAVDASIDVALVLGLAFDRRGVRLGHGRGYFDRFFARHAPLRVGLALDEQFVAELPRDAHDVAMDVLVTPGGVLRWRR